MAAEEPRDFRVRLDWPEEEAGHAMAPAPAKRAPRKGRGDKPDAEPAKGAGAAAESSAAVEVRPGPRGTEPVLPAIGRRLDDLSRRMDALARMVESIAAQQQPQDLDAVSTALEQLTERVDKMVRAVRPLPKTTQTLSDRVEKVSETVRSLPRAAAVAELAGRVEGLADAVETISSLYVANSERMAAAMTEVSAELAGLTGVAASVRRLTDGVSSATAQRAARQGEFEEQILGLADQLEALRAAFPANDRPARTPRKRAATPSTRTATAKTAKATKKAAKASKASKAATTPTGRRSQA
jgi:ABC-type transporter Mla subunit MlaD